MHAAGDLRKAPLLLQDGDRPLVGRTRVDVAKFRRGGREQLAAKGRCRRGGIGIEERKPYSVLIIL